MSRTTTSWGWLLGIAIASAYSFSGNYANAQNITLDGTLGPAGTLNGPDYTIPQEVGQTIGSNLFHSFGRFNLNTGEIANFESASNIRNILSRVTGGLPSSIDGLISTNSSSVNVFLLNPSGIIFGPNARLDVGGATRGSFVATTVDALVWSNGGQFSATNPGGASSLLTIVGDPSGFLSSLRSPSPITSTLSRLRVYEGQSLLLLGGNLTLNNSNLFVDFTEGGRIELAGVADAGTVGLGVNGNILSLNIPENLARADVLLQNGTSIDVIAGNGGSIAVNARNLDILGGSALVAGIGQGLGSVDSRAGDITLNATGEIRVVGSGVVNDVERQAVGNGGNLTINTQQLLVQDGTQVVARTLSAGEGGDLTVSAESVQLIGTDANGQFPSGLFASAESGATGDAGNLTINTQQLLVRDGAQVSAGTFGAGSSGNLTVFANTVQVIGRSANGQFPSGLFASAASSATGDAGDLTINTQQLLVRDGARVDASTFGAGKGGNLTVSAESVQLIGTSADGQASSGLFARAESGATGDAGNLTINTQELLVQDGAVVSAGTFSAGEGGNLTVFAESVQLIGRSADGQVGSGLFAQANPGATGDAGNLTINTLELLVRDGAQVSAGTFSAGEGGNLTVSANTVQLIGIGTSADGRPVGSGLFTTADRGATGDAGNLTINTLELLVGDGARVDASTFGAGEGGNLTVSANTVQLIGTTADGQFPTSLSTQANLGATGDAGNLTINTQQLLVQDGASVFVRSLGTGNAGNLTIDAGSIYLNNGTLTADTRSINTDSNQPQATITLRAKDFVLLRRGSNITVNAQGENVIGGNINIDTNFLVALENSDISANSTDFRGGRVTINARGIFGTQSRNTPTSESDITATGGVPELRGTVEVNTSIVDYNVGLVELPTALTDASGLIASNCAAFDDTQGSTFTVTGRGGLPPSPDEPLSSDVVWSDTRLPIVIQQHRAETPVAKPPSNSNAVAIVPATGWVFNDKGEVTLISHAPNATGLASTDATCPRR